MEQDLKLKKRTTIWFIATLAIVLLCSIIQIVLFSKYGTNLNNEKWYMIVSVIFNLLYVIAGGIVASGFLLVLTKAYDYESKKKELLNEYYANISRFQSSIQIIKPYTGDNRERCIKSYESFIKSNEIFIKSQEIYKKFTFSKNDKNLEKIIRSINSYFENSVPKFYLTKDYLVRNIYDENYERQILNLQRQLFYDEPRTIVMQSLKYKDKKSDVSGLGYFNNINKELMPELNELEIILFKEKRTYVFPLPIEFKPNDLNWDD